MARVEKDIEVDVPVSTAYNQWTQFESFPQFMEGVEEVRQVTDSRVHWKASVFGKTEEWDADIREQVPDQKIVWKSVGGEFNAGIVEFFPQGAGRTKVHLEMSYEPKGALESVGDAVGLLDRRIEGDLKRFKEFIEGRGMETGGWRGEIDNPDKPGGHTEGRPAAH